MIVLIFWVFVIRMLANNHAYEKWEERILSKENGKREIRYYLVSTSASPLLAVVGMEKRDRHYSYVVSEEFLQAIGPNPAINTNEKWTSRKNVKEWLESLVRENNQPPTNSSMNSWCKVLNVIVSFYITCWMHRTNLMFELNCLCNFIHTWSFKNKLSGSHLILYMGQRIKSINIIHPDSQKLFIIGAVSQIIFKNEKMIRIEGLP